MKILCQERYDEAVAYAKKIGDITLQECLERLQKWEDIRIAEGYEMVLYKDFAPHSMGFALRRDNGEVYIRGGLNFHGNPDESCSFTCDKTIGWQIHT